MTGPDSIAVGAAVRLLPRWSTVLPGRRLAGGDAVVIGVLDDSHGTVYRLQLERGGALHCARREHLVLAEAVR